MSSRSKFLVVSSSSLLMVLLLLGAVKGRSAEPADAYKHLMVFTEVLSRIKSDYVEEPNIKNVTLGALNGLLESIDPYASYLDAEQYRQYQKNQSGARAGVGLVLSRRYGYVGVVDVVPGSPAAKAGLNTNDMLESINGVATRDMPLAYAEMILQGDPGSNVDISVLRVAHPEPQKMTLSRAVVKYPAAASKLLPDQVGYIQTATLETGKAKEVATALQELQRQGAKRFVLDLRNCAAGNSAEGVALANLFVDKGTLGYVQGQRYSRQNFEAAANKQVTKLPVVVITNRGTADAAEVAAAALLDNKRAEIVGEKTYGFAGLRKAVAMEDGGAVILSVAKYYSPAGKAIQDNSVTPSVPVAEVEAVPDTDDNDDQNPTPPVAPQPKKSTEDVLLKRAVEVVTKGSGSNGAVTQGKKDESAPRMAPLNIPQP